MSTNPMKRLLMRARCWWYENWHWMPWNWIPRRGYLVHYDGVPGYIVYGRASAYYEIDAADPEDKPFFTLTRVWISPHKLAMSGEFKGW